MRRAFLAAFLALVALGAPAQEAARKPTRVLFIGNSLTFTGNIPSRVALLARDMGRAVETEAVAEPAFSL